VAELGTGRRGAHGPGGQHRAAKSAMSRADIVHIAATALSGGQPAAVRHPPRRRPITGHELARATRNARLVSCRAATAAWPTPAASASAGSSPGGATAVVASVSPVPDSARRADAQVPRRARTWRTPRWRWPGAPALEGRTSPPRAPVLCASATGSPACRPGLNRALRAAAVGRPPCVPAACLLGSGRRRRSPAFRARPPSAPTYAPGAAFVGDLVARSKGTALR